MLIILIIVGIFLLAGYIWLFTFFHFMPFSLFITRITTPDSRKHMIKSALTFGFGKASFRKFCRHVRSLIYSEPIATTGQRAPEVEVTTLDGEARLLSSYMQNKLPLVITFGSYTCPPYVKNTVSVVDIFNKYGQGESKVVEFLMVYIEEAHAKDDWKVPVGINPGADDICMHKNVQDRMNAGLKFAKDLQYPIPLVCDSMKNQANIRYECLPSRLYIVEEGVVVYKGGRGPFFYKPEEVLEILQTRFGER